MGAQMPRRRMSARQRAEEELATFIEDATGDLPPVEDEDTAEAVIGELLGTGESDDAGEAESARPPDFRLPPHFPRIPKIPKLPKFPRPPSHVVRLDQLEVTQEIQDLSHSVPLVAGKSTIVRAYLSRRGPAIAVRGELRVSRRPNGPWISIPSIGTAQLSPTRSGSTLAQLRSRRANLAYSLNFRLPRKLVAQPGVLYLRMGKLRRARGQAAVPSVAHVRRHTRRISNPAQFRLRLVLMSYAQGGSTHTPTSTDVALLRSYLRRAYPVNRVLMSTRTVTANPAAPFTAAQVNTQLAAMRAVDVATGTDARTHYYGMVADGGFFMRGRAAGIPGTAQPQTVASGPTGDSGFSWDTDGSYGDWYGAHELGHTLGRLHAEFCGAGGGGPYPFANGQLSDADEKFVGIDTGDTSNGIPLHVMHPITSHDVMSYCDDQWLSSFTYEAVYQRLLDTEALPGSGAVPAGAGEEGPLSMRMFASVNLTRNDGEISALLPSALVGAAPANLQAAAEPDAQVRAQVLDANGEVLDEQDVPFVRSSCEEADEDVTGTIDAALPEPQGAAQVRLLVDGRVVSEYAVGGSAAEPASLSATLPEDAGPGEPGGSEPSVELSWDAANAPESQRYVVQVSDSEGDTRWETVAVGLDSTSLLLPASDFDADEIQVRIFATTGTDLVELAPERVQVRSS